MPEELGTVLENLSGIREEKFGDLTIFSGSWKNTNHREIKVSTAWSGWGKVSAARATTRMCAYSKENLEIDFLLFTGVAGAVNANFKQWDIVIPDSVLQHDMDARPLFQKFAIPVLDIKEILPSKYLHQKLKNALIFAKNKGNLNDFGSINEGLIATGDSFISDSKKLKELKDQLPNLQAVEMEGAAFAQVAKQEKFEWVILRVISDGADDEAQKDFSLFLNEYKLKSWELIKSFFDSF